MNLAAYLDRIGHGGPTRPDLATLKALHRAHLLAIPYENLDVQFGRPLTPEPAAAYDKLVTRRRGGWCYEMNGLLGWALGEVGFDVTRIAGGVMRGLRGDWAIGTHLVLKVMVEGRPWIADVGFGGMTPTAPLRLVADEVQATPHGPMRLILRDAAYFLQAQVGGAAVDGAAWRTLYRFDLQPQHPIDYVVGNHYVSTFAESIFRNSLKAARPLADGRLTLANNRFTEYRLDGGETVTLLEDAAAIRRVLQDRFNVTVPDSAAFDRRVVELGFVAA